jgi:hypothetical protein
MFLRAESILVIFEFRISIGRAVWRHFFCDSRRSLGMAPEAQAGAVGGSQIENRKSKIENARPSFRLATQFQPCEIAADGVRKRRRCPIAFAETPM